MSTLILAFLDQPLRGPAAPQIPLFPCGLAPLDPRALIAPSVNPTTQLVRLFRIWRTENSCLWKCMLFSELNTLEVYTILGDENVGCVYNFQNWKTMEVYAIFGAENCGSAYYPRS